MSFPSFTSKKPGENSDIWTFFGMFLPFFGMYGKRRPLAIPRDQISIPQAFIFQVHGGCNNPPPPLG